MSMYKSCSTTKSGQGKSFCITWPLVGQAELIVTIILLIWIKTLTQIYSNKFHHIFLK